MSSSKPLSFLVWSKGPALEQHLSRKKTIFEIANRYLSGQNLQFFSNCVFYLDIYEYLQISSEFGIQFVTPKSQSELDFKTRLLLNEIMVYGGTVVDEIIPETTHIILLNNEKLQQILAYQVKINGPIQRICLLDWIIKCIENKSLVDEELFT